MYSRKLDEEVICYVNVYKPATVELMKAEKAEVWIAGGCLVVDTGNVRVAFIAKHLAYALNMDKLAGGGG